MNHNNIHHLLDPRYHPDFHGLRHLHQYLNRFHHPRQVHYHLHYLCLFQDILLS